MLIDTLKDYNNTNCILCLMKYILEKKVRSYYLPNHCALV